MLAVSPDEVIHQLPALVYILVFIERRTSRQCHTVESASQSRNFGMRAVPMQIVIAITQAGFIDKISAQRANVTYSPGPGVFMQRVDEIFLRCPDILGQVQP